ncbi:alkaline phosphatase [Bengtsoniella intestinalis]|uniref:alkaline phosphatase n=1 Tax=Bengtsoniella intestinalis TaxID=3073143 RepID=UPI00391FB73A
MKTQNFKRILACLLAVATLTGSALAASGTNSINALYNNIKVMVGGQETTLTDVNGNVVEPFIVDGTTYVPIRGAAEALGETVSYNSDTNSVEIGNQEAPKYVFVFIGDGLSHVQTQLTNYYLDAMSQDAVAPLAQDDIEVSADRDLSAILTSTPQLTYMGFESTGITTTYDSTSFCPDSASTASSIATGNKTHSGAISVAEDLVTEYATMAEQMHDMGMKVGIVSSVTINHATPAAFYAHDWSRDNYYDIGLDLIDSGFEYFAGGAINKPDNSGTATSIYTLAEQAGYTVVNADQAAAEKITAADGKVIITGEDTNGGALPYEFEREEDMWALSDYVSKGIEVLDNDNGFFMMVEAGKIDWACHANDAYSAIGETIAFSNAIDEAVAFYNQHPDETLIIVTGDHETGGMTVGYVSTWYDTFLAQLSSQTGSYDTINATITADIEAGASFETVLADIEAFCGLTTDAGEALSLTDYEIAKLQTAYDVQFEGLELDAELSTELYGGYKPVAITVMTLMNNKSGVDFTSTSHTGVTVGTYAQGVGSELFNGFYDNTDIYNNVAQIMGLN